MNVTIVKLNKKRNKLMIRPQLSSSIFTPQAVTDYDKKKAEEKKAIIDEIKRVKSIDV